MVMGSGEAYGIQVVVDETMICLAPQICPGHREPQAFSDE